MIRKLMLAALCLLPISGFAAWGSGFYLGAGVGADMVNFNNTAYVSQPKSFYVINKSELSAQGILGNIFGGYSWYRNWFYLGGELNGNISSADTQMSNEELVHNSSSSTTIKINRSWGIGLLPGIMLPETTLLYTRVGLAEGSFHINTTDTSLANADASLAGLRLGLGLEKRVYKNLGVRAEYSHINYQEFSQSVFEPIGNVTKRTVISPEANQFELDLDWRFA